MTDIQNIPDDETVRFRIYELLHHLAENGLLSDENIKHFIWELATKTGSSKDYLVSSKKHSRAVRKIILDTLIENDHTLG